MLGNLNTRNILVVEDSVVESVVLQHILSQSSRIQPHYAESFAEAKQMLASDTSWFAAIVDLNLPDAPNGEVVDFVLEKKIPTLVLTAAFDERRREELVTKGVVDYITKEGRYAYEYTLGVIHRLIGNLDIQVLVADDSDTSRKYLNKLLSHHLYQVFEACDGVQAIKILLENPGIKLLITDFNMPRMDGFELVKNLRYKYEKSDLVIVGVSSGGDGVLSAKFIKYGANDFLRKPFNPEEFYCRISHNIEFIELIEKIKDSVKRDDLTGVYNRKYFCEIAEKKYNQAVSGDSPFSLAVIELDEFARINSVYGTDTGDEVMRLVSGRLNDLLDRFILGRAVGQKFLACFTGLTNAKTVKFVEKIRQIIAMEKIPLKDQEITLTYSAGVSSCVGENFDDLVTNAENCLRRAKEAGGDLVFGDE